MSASFELLELLQNNLDPNGKLNFEQAALMSPRPFAKKKLLCSSLETGLSVFCPNAAETVANNILQSPNGAFFDQEINSTLEYVLQFGKSDTLLSAIALSLLVHASKCDTAEQAGLFVEFAADLASEAFRMAQDTSSYFSNQFCCPTIVSDLLGMWIGSEVPSQNFMIKVRRLLSGTILKDSLLDGLPGLTVADIDDIEIYFVQMQSTELSGWCVPGGIVLNLHALQSSAALIHPIACAVLCGHEIRHEFERKHAGNDLNFSTPEKAEQNPLLRVGHRESGLGFELSAIGSKYNYSVNCVTTREDVFVLLDAIEAGIKQNRRPALSPAEQFGFEHLELSHNAEMPFEYFRRQ